MLVKFYEYMRLYEYMRKFYEYMKRKMCDREMKFYLSNYKQRVP